MTDEQERRAALEAAVAHDIDLIIAACAPLDWTQAAPAEPKEALGCTHPLPMLLVNLETMAVRCKNCGYNLDREEVGWRMDAR